MSHIQRRSTGTPFRKFGLPLPTLRHSLKSARPRHRLLLLVLVLLLLAASLFLLLFLLPLLRPADLPPRIRALSSPSPSWSSPLSSRSAPLPAASLSHALVVAPPGTPLSTALQTALALRTQAPTLPIHVWHDDPSPMVPEAWPSGVSVVRRALRAPYAHVLHPMDGSAHRAMGQRPLYLRAGVELAPRAMEWVEKALSVYAGRPDVGGVFMEAAQVKKRKKRKKKREKGQVEEEEEEEEDWEGVEVGEQGGVMWRGVEGWGGFVPNWGRDLDVWGTFAEWLTVRRGEWYRFPEGGGVDGTVWGMEGVERNWTRGEWNVWFGKFLWEYGLWAVYPGLGGEGLVRFVGDEEQGGEQRLYVGSGEFEMAEKLIRYAGDGEVVEEEDAGGGDVERIVELGRAQGGVVSFTMVNKIFLETAKSWLCNVDEGRFRPKGLLWAVTDEESREAMESVQGATTVLLEGVKGGKETGHEFGNPGYWKLMLERTALIGEILRRGVAVFAFETDAIWLEDPAPYIEELTRQDADIVGTINTRMEVSGNFFYLRPTLATRRLWDEITREFTKAYEAAHLGKKEATSWTYIENDQSLLTKLVLRNETWRRSYPLSFLTLDMEKFTDGRWYKPEEGFYTSERAREPVVINNNFVIGVDEKTERAKKWGHWFWDAQKGQCDKQAVSKAVARETPTRMETETNRVAKKKAEAVKVS